MRSSKVLTRQSIGDLAHYYESGADDYYAKEGESNQWHGKGAEALGLTGEVDPARFRELLSGKATPDVAYSRTATRMDQNERIGIDFTFSAPKSVSMQALIAGDPALIKAHDRAVAATLDAMEPHAMTRKKVKGKTSVEHTGNLIAAKFRHETSRELDPQLHTHAIVMNLTQRSDGEWRALKNDQLLDNKKFGAIYQAELAKGALEAGYELRYNQDGSWDLAHFSREEIQHFSQRSQQIESTLEQQGKTRATATTAEKQQITMLTRARKGESYDRDSLHRAWTERAKEAGVDFDRREWKGAGAEHAPETSARGGQMRVITATEAVQYAVKHIAERESVMSERQILRTALAHGRGQVAHDEITREIDAQRRKGYLIREDPIYRPGDARDAKQDMSRAQWVATLTAMGLSRPDARSRVGEAINKGRLSKQEARYTTQTAREREKRILQIEREGRGQVAPVMDRAAAHTRLADKGLNSGQLDAAKLILTTQDRIIGIQGFAGVGKTTLLKPAKAELEAAGYEVRAVAPNGSQVKALRDSGIPAQTLASLLVAKDKGLSERTVLVLDEAGTVPSRQMEQLMKLVERSGARMIQAGDVAQTKAIEAGRPFDQLQAAGMATARVDEIVRQRDADLKVAVELAANGQTSQSLDKIKDVQEHAKDSDRHQAIVDRYLALEPKDRDETLIISGTNDARRALNGMIREAIGTAGEGIVFDTLVRRDTTQQQRRFSHNYQVNDVIQPDRDYKCGLMRGETYRIIDTGPGNRLTVEREGEQISFSPRSHTKLSVYRPERSELSVGDKVRITHNNARLDLANGDRFSVEAVSPGKVTLANGKQRVELPTDKPLHLDHAYASTVHAAQGVTADRVLIDADTKTKITTKDVYYVAISRARYEAQIFTDSVKSLPDAIAREANKTAALDFDRRDGRSRTAERETEHEAPQKAAVGMEHER